MTAEVRDGRSTRWDPHRRERRLLIINAAIEAIEEYGPQALTGQIAERAGVPRTHVYRHFDGKQALDLAVARHVANQIGEQIRGGLAKGGSARQIIGAAITEHLGWVQAHPNLYRFLAGHAYAVNATGSPTVDDAKAAFAAELSTLLAGYMQAFKLDSTPAERVIVGIVGMVDATAAWWLDHDHVAFDELTEQLTDQVWLVIDNTTRRLGLVLDPDSPLPPLPTPVGA